LFNSQLQYIVPINVKWNFNISAYEGIKDEYLRELFRQLKNICSNNLDKFSQLKFEQLEMHFYSKELKWGKNFGDWLILMSNRYSNNHGQDWQRALKWLFLFSIINYVFLHISFKSFSCFHVGNFLSFVLPIHSLKDILCGEQVFNGWVMFWDMLQRLISSYLIFQFLRAFRKYVN
jgi:hypothetical protein